MNQHEEKWLDTFIVKEKRDRWRLFLEHPKKRGRILARLNHVPDLDARYAKELPSNADIPSILRKHESPERVYIVSDDRDLDGKTLPLDEAIHEVEFASWGSVISCIPGRLAYYHGEVGERRALMEKKK